MSREIRRVPSGFGWPLDETWAGYFKPEFLRSKPCPDCELGFSPEAEILHQEWYGWTDFDPTSRGSIPFLADGEDAVKWAKRQIESNPKYYGTGDGAIARETERITRFWNGAWSHHLSQADVDVLVEEGRLWDLTRKFVPGEGWQDLEEPHHPTAEEVNRWSLFGLGHDGINAGICIRARCEREELPYLCETCGGVGSLERFAGQSAAADAWVPLDPPTGEAWQLWETVSEGSPISPAFDTPEELAEHIAGNPKLMGVRSVTEALNWITGSGWAPTAIFIREAAA